MSDQDLKSWKTSKLVSFFSQFIFGFNLKSYTFNKYKTLNKEKINKKVNYKIISSNKKNIENNYKYYHAIKEGVFLARDLVSEPPNVLNPKTYVQEIKKLSKLGLKVKAYNEKELKKLVVLEETRPRKERCWRFPPLEECRNHFEEKYGIKITEPG